MFFSFWFVNRPHYPNFSLSEYIAYYALKFILFKHPIQAFQTDLTS